MTIRQDSEQGLGVPPALNEAATGKAILENAEKMLEAVNEAGRTIGALTISFIVLTAILGIARSTVLVEAEHLVKESTTSTLPLINVTVNTTTGFFVTAPMLIIAFRFYLLLEFHLLGQKVRHLDKLVASLPDNEKRYIRDRITNSVFVHLLVKSCHLSRTMKFLVCFSLLYLPSITLSSSALQFSPYDNLGLTTFLKIITIIDLGIIIALWPKIVSEQSTWCWWWQRLQGAWERIKALWEWIFRRRSEPPTDRALSSPISEKPGIGALWIVATVVISLFQISVPGLPLILSGKVLVSNKLAPEIVNILREGSGHERERALDKVLGLDLTGRNLSEAILDNTILTKANLNKAQLMFAYLQGAQLQRANLKEANLKGAFLYDAKLQEADLRGAQLQDAFLAGAQLQGADLREAQLQGANLVEAELQGARLGISADSPSKAAQLQGANLIGAQLQGANLRGAQLQGANLAGAQLGGADLQGAAIGGAQFSSKDNSMPPAVLDLADLRGIERTPFSKGQYKEQYKKISEVLERDIKLTHTPFVTSSVTSSLKELKVSILEHLKALVCRPKTHCRPDTLDHVKHANQCLSNSPNILSCLAEDHISEYREALTPYLVKLACSDPSVARGVVERAIDIKDFYVSLIRSSGPPRDTLAGALMAEQCEAVKALPEYSKKRLAKALETQKMLP